MVFTVSLWDDLGGMACRAGAGRAGCNTSCPLAGAVPGGHPGPVTGKMTFCAAVRRCRPGDGRAGQRAGFVPVWAGTAGALGACARASDPPAGRRAVVAEARAGTVPGLPPHPRCAARLVRATASARHRGHRHGGRHRVTRQDHLGPDPKVKTWTLVPAAAPTRRTACRGSGARAGKVVRGLSHPQDGPLTTGGAIELQPGPAPCGQLVSRTASRMAVPLSPSTRERA